MPPALSDDETSDMEPQATTTRSSRSSRSLADNAPGARSDDEEGPVAANGGSEVDGEDDEADEDLEEDVFIVEAIKSHMIDEDGSLRFQVKWEGYESKKDLTWEPEENLVESAQEILDEYFRRFGGRENIFNETEKAARGRKRGRAASSAGAAAAATTTAKRSRKNGTHPRDSAPPASAKPWQPPAGSWEEEIATIDACEDEGKGKLVVYLIWKNGQKTKHETSVIYKKCPQKMLQFYERHVKIIRDDDKTAA
ncbi:heterochromatin protein one [Metarhizium album ARSEF 1941]|uniref:Heterochromatin protein one n=1 Tax=Metarhizium album (strain ARSEF 1941) TaxID=1081103 RepID=A0A0B2X8G0_METAS|nr:heterochromatin protein one [Metarhizium album ARSEF 1941]KHO01800.1 heterochromatin protein one [Metarhizium album ARSEF 1941]